MPAKDLWTCFERIWCQWRLARHRHISFVESTVVLDSIPNVIPNACNKRNEWMTASFRLEQCPVYFVHVGTNFAHFNIWDGCCAQIMALHVLRCHYMGSCLDYAWCASFLASLLPSVIDVHNVLSLSLERPGRKTQKLLQMEAAEIRSK